MKKKVVVIVRTSPLNTMKSVEAFRLGVGLTLEGNQVDICLMEEGVWNALPVNSKRLGRLDVDQFIQSLEICGIGAYVDSEALPPSYHHMIKGEIKIKPKKEIIELIKQAEVVIPF